MSLGDYPIVSLDKIYLNIDNEFIYFLDSTRLNGETNLVSRTNMNDLESVDKQIKRLSMYFKSLNLTKIIIAEDVSDNTRKSIINSCEYYSVKYIEYSDMFDLGNAVGADGERGVVSVNDEGFAKTIFEKYSDLKSGRNGE